VPFSLELYIKFVPLSFPSSKHCPLLWTNYSTDPVPQDSIHYNLLLAVPRVQVLHFQSELGLSRKPPHLHYMSTLFAARTTPPCIRHLPLSPPLAWLCKVAIPPSTSPPYGRPPHVSSCGISLSLSMCCCPQCRQSFILIAHHACFCVDAFSPFFARRTFSSHSACIFYETPLFRYLGPN